MSINPAEDPFRDDPEFVRHVEYIHYNSVKHGFVKSQNAWPHTTFHRYVKQGIYHSDWGADQDIVIDHQIGDE
jgi:putative transposase